MKRGNSIGKSDISALVEQYYSEFASKHKLQILADRDPSTWASTEAMRKAMTKRIAVQKEIFQNYFLNRAGKVLDVGCGFGRQALILARTGYNVIACDICQSFLDIGKAVADREGLSIDFMRMDIKELQFQDNYFDYVLLLDTIEHIPENGRGPVFSEVSRVLKKEGLVVISIPHQQQSHTINRATNIIKSYYKRPRSFLRALGRILISRIIKLIKPGRMKITEEHPFPLPAVNEIAEYLADDFNIINQRNTEATSFLVAQRK